MRDRIQTAILALLLGTTGPVALIESVQLNIEVVGETRTLVFALAALMGVALNRLLQHRLPVLPTLEHELTHLLVATALLRKPLELRAGPGTGHVLFGPGWGTPLILLAPYVLPTVPVVVLALSLAFGTSDQLSWVSAIGVAWGYQLTRAAYDARPHQSDLRTGGLVPSAIAVGGGASWTFAAVALFGLGGTPLVQRWLTEILAWV